MTSALPESAQRLLTQLGFEFIKAEHRSKRELWLNQTELPHLQIHILPGEDITRSIHAAGGRDQREMTRSAYNRFVETFRNGEHVAPALDLLHLTEDVPSLQASTNPKA